MSEQKPAARPRQVTMAVVTAVVGSLVLIMSLFDTLGRLRTPESRQAIDDFLAAPPGSGLGVDTAQVIGAMRGLAFVSGALAAALLVFAVYLLQRHKGARIGFTVVAGLLLLTIPVAGLMPVLVAVGAVLLWTRPARDWYAGRAPAAPAAVAPAGPPPSLFSEQDPAPPAPPTDATTTPPPAPVPYGGPVGQPPPYVPMGPSAWPTSSQGYGGPRPRDPEERPTTVTIAAVLTWLGAGSVAAVMMLFGLVLATGGQFFVDEFNRAAADRNLSFTREEILAVGWLVTVFFLVWSVIAMVLAALAFRRSNGARIALVVSAVMAALVSLVLILSVVSVVTLLMAGATAVLLFTGGANEWYSRSGRPGAFYHQPPTPEPPRGRVDPW